MNYNKKNSLNTSHHIYTFLKNYLYSVACIFNSVVIKNIQLKYNGNTLIFPTWVIFGDYKTVIQ